MESVWQLFDFKVKIFWYVGYKIKDYKIKTYMYVYMLLIL